MVIKIPKDKISKIDIINVQGGITATQVYKKYKPDYMINLSLYDMATGTNITYLKDEGISSGYLFSEYGIGIIGDNEIVSCHKSNTRVRDFVGGSPILVKNGAKCIEWGNKYSEYVAVSHYRSAFGFNDSEVILYSSDEKMSLDELSQALISENCQFAINLDGGGSCHLQKGEKVLRKSLRANASWLLVYLKEEKKMPKVCIDAGHGIDTAGKRSPDGSLLEYEFNRDVANRIEYILARHDVEVLTCYGDTDTPLNQRCKMANLFNVDYFVSIHANAYGETWNDANGWEIYVVSKGGKAEQLAQKIHKYSQELGLKDRGIKTANFTVLTDTDMPAVLIEHGFYTNKEECEKLKDSSFRQKCAIADAKGILEQLGINYVPDTNVGTKLVLTIDSKEYTVNGQVKQSDVAPKIENGRTMVPVYLLRELNIGVEWNENTKEVSIWK